MAAPPSVRYICDSCTQSVLPEEPRVRCSVCQNYDLCAKCFLGERVTVGHDLTHQVQVFKQSGDEKKAPVPASSPLFAHIPPPAISQESPTVSGWQPFFRADMSPTPTFLSLMNDLFTYMDPANNGNLEPEALSRLWDDMGMPIQENGWKSALHESGTMSKESNADKSLKSIFDLFSIEHVLLLRTRPVSRTPHQGPMPAITRHGFIELFTINQLSEPSTEWAALNRAMQKYRLPKYSAWGDIPRSVLPEMPHPGMVQRVENIKKYQLQKSMDALEAARTNAMIRARGRQAALDVLGDTRTEYVYGYRW